MTVSRARSANERFLVFLQLFCDVHSRRAEEMQTLIAQTSAGIQLLKDLHGHGERTAEETSTVEPRIVRCRAAHAQAEHLQYHCSPLCSVVVLGVLCSVWYYT